MYNNGNPFIPNSTEGMDTLQLHVQHIHKDIFISLPPEQLLNIGWSRCCPACPTFFLTASDQLTSHQNQCPTYIDTTNTTNTNTTTDANDRSQPQVHNFSNDPTWALAFNICPPDKYEDLNVIINNTDDFVDPATILPNLLMTVSQWCLDRTTRSTTQTTPTINTATTNNNHG